jgi:hypothetical protein
LKIKSFAKKKKINKKKIVILGETLPQVDRAGKE